MSRDDKTTEMRPSGEDRPQPRFVSGAVLASRYRIVSLLGRGGMGEVYRAEDLKLGVTVALKFLPESVANDKFWLEGMLREVRTARKISHPNVCRVYDVGEVDGQNFLSMELIEGEDLASLLRRIGRLPEEKALELARQLCAGLAAAHDLGIIHRDLKPANVMIDDRGRARITDFGLASAVADLTARSAREGTPAYQAPEQLAGREVSERSDIYALGLVLYELFTGKRPFEAGTREDLLRLQMQSNPTTPTALVERLDPLIERAILTCLRPEPQERPASPLQIAAILPGGDPLQAALAAGETPSPEAVAAASAEGSLSPAVAGAALAAAIALLIFIVFAGERARIHQQFPLPRSPEQLALRAEQVLSLAGVPIENHQRVYGWFYDEPLLRALQSEKRSRAEWEEIRRRINGGITPPMLFWHQTSDELDVRRELRPSARGIPRSRPGETWVALDPAGRIQELEIAPSPDVAAAADVDWRPILSETAVPLSSLVPDAPRWRPPVFSDRLYAWKSNDPNFPVRIEGASAGGKPVWLSVLGPGDVPSHAAVIEQPIGEKIFIWLLVAFYVIAIITGAVLAWRNARSGRGDRRGAFRIAAVLFTTQLLSWVLGGLHVASLSEVFLLAQALMSALLAAAILWTLYMALEPIIRRVWPQRLISWNRILAGSWRDPMVGRDMLAGTIAGLLMTAGTLASGLLLSRSLGRDFDLLPIIPFTLEGFRGMLYILLGSTTQGGLIVPFASLTFIVLLGLVIRRMTIAAVVFWLLFAGALSLQAPNELGFVAIKILVTGAFTLALARFGLLAAIVSQVVFFFTCFYPITPDVQAWFFPVSCFMIGLTLALAIYGLVISIGPRKAWIPEESLR